MSLNQSYSLQNSNSFNIAVSCSQLYLVETLEELLALPELCYGDFYILGDGSNTLFVEPAAPVIIKPAFKGITVNETKSHYKVTVGAAENWHDLVSFCIEHGINGLENLALIPGSVGAAPVQNIGAYGVEFADFCLEVSYFDLITKQLKALSAQECKFSYRDSIFKNCLHNRALITELVLLFPKAWQANLNYSGLDVLPVNVDAKVVMNKVIELRQSKLPDPKKLPNAGSFFKNPIVSQEKFLQIQTKYPQIPHYPQSKGNVKLAAGWLIEQSGLKGFRFKGVGVDQRQALVLVNYENGTGQDLITLAKFVQQQVFEMFSVKIIPEVRMVSAQGEVHFEKLNGDSVINGVNYD
ncbi:UDP-N-acetylmuramate dehydrogenase [Colwellia asteriadis]|uniref:UDP-N-acetylenolpyruvoylglucosamine reductase n=1 Tax=Colwellia asteriadis TaxID=517723 RepID=A0ABN1L3Q6_9GAMM